LAAIAGLADLLTDHVDGIAAIDLFVLQRSVSGHFSSDQHAADVRRLRFAPRCKA